MKTKYSITLTAILILLTMPGFTTAADHRNLEEDLPIAVEDAYPIEYRSVELQGRFGYNLLNNESDEFLLEPRIEAGLFKNNQVTVKVPILLGDGGALEGTGDIEIGALYNFNTETNIIPALALAVEERFPSGKDSDSFETTVKGIITKGFGQHRFHFNGSYINVANRDEGERENLYFLGVGYDRPISIDALFLADFYTMRASEDGEDQIFVGEAGVRYALNPWTVLSLGLGTGFGSSREAPDFIVTLGYQTNLIPLPF